MNDLLSVVAKIAAMDAAKAAHDQRAEDHGVKNAHPELTAWLDSMADASKAAIAYCRTLAPAGLSDAEREALEWYDSACLSGVTEAMDEARDAVNAVALAHLRHCLGDARDAARYRWVRDAVLRGDARGAARADAEIDSRLAVAPAGDGVPVRGGALRRETLTVDATTPPAPSPVGDVKPFPAGGAWFPTDLFGDPMREYEPGKWESLKPTTQQTGAVAWERRHPKVNGNRALFSDLSLSENDIRAGWTQRPLIYGDTSPGARVDEAKNLIAQWRGFADASKAQGREVGGDFIRCANDLEAALNAGEAK